jgi:dihydroflavonol-4-reductase
MGKEYSASLQFIEKLIDGSLPGLPRLGIAMVDVRGLPDLQVARPMR